MAAQVIVRWTTAGLALCATACFVPDHRFERDEIDPPARVTRAILDWSGNLAEPGRFFDAPFPSLLRTAGDGRLRWDGFGTLPDAHGLAAAQTYATSRTGASLRPVIYVRFDGPLAPLAPSEHSIDGVAGIYLIELADPPAQPRRIPVIAQTLPVDPRLPDHVLAITPVPGAVLRPSTYYGVYVSTDLLDAAGRAVGVNDELAALRGGAPALSQAAQMLAPLWPAIPVEITLAGPAAATVFRTGDPASGVKQRANAALSAPITIDPASVSLVVDAARMTTDLCELTGTVAMPQFQQGIAPYPTGGAFASPLAAQRTEPVTFTIAVPRQAMPVTGYPLALSLGELDDRHDVALAPVTVDGTAGDAEGRRFGLGTGIPLARAGIATASLAVPQGRERGDLRSAQLRADNLPLVTWNDEQAVLELALLRQAIASLQVPATTLTGCLDPALLGSSSVVQFSSARTGVQGHGHGGSLALLAALADPSIAGVVATGARGGLTERVTRDEASGGFATMLAAALETDPAQLSRLHPALALLDAAIEEVDAEVVASYLVRGDLDTRGAIAALHAVVAEDLEVPVDDAAALARALAAPLVGTLSATALTQLVSSGGQATASYPLSAPSTTGPGATLQAPAPAAPAPAHDAIFHQRGLRYQATCLVRTAIAGAAVIVAPVDRDDAFPCD